MNHQYINTKTNSYPRYHADIQAHYPLMSLAEDLSQSPPAPFEFVQPSGKPTINPVHQQLLQAMPKKVNGVWVQQWTVIEIFNTQAGKDAALAADLAAKKDNVQNAIKAKRDQLRFQGGIKVGGHWFKSDQTATGEYAALALIAGNLPADTVIRANWRTMDGAAVSMTPALVRQILAAGFAQVAMIDDVAQAHLEAVAASGTPCTYDFSTDWPATFEDPASTHPYVRPPMGEIS